MANTLRIKRRAAGGAAGAPSTLANAELAFNEQDSVLYYGVGTGGSGGSATTIIAIGGPGAFARLNGAAFTGATTGLTPVVDNNSTSFATTAWVIGQRSAANPAMNGSAAAGSSSKWAAGDHVHPVDTSRAPVSNPAFTGRATMPAGSTGVAGGLTLTSGSVKTSPVAGDSGGIEYDGVNVSVINSSGQRKTFVFTDGSISTASNLSGGDAGSLPYQTAAGATSMLAPGTGAQILTGGATPSWTDISSLSVASAANATNSSQLGGVSAASYARLANPTFTGSVNIPTAAGGDNSTLAASTAFVQAAVSAAVQGLDPKGSCRVGTTANLGSLSGLLTIDGVTLIAGDRVLVKDQTAQASNGIYVAAAGAWTRSIDMDNWLEVPGAYVFVRQGTVNKDLGFTCTSDVGGTLNTTAITWVQFNSAGSYSAGNGISIATNVITALGVAGRITVGPGGIDIASTYAGQATITTLGTIATGVWNATAIAPEKGGTGLTSAVTGLLLGNGTTYSTAVADTDYLTPSSPLDGGTF